MAIHVDYGTCDPIYNHAQHSLKYVHVMWLVIEVHVEHIIPSPPSLLSHSSLTLPSLLPHSSLTLLSLLPPSSLPPPSLLSHSSLTPFLLLSHSSLTPPSLLSHSSLTPPSLLSHSSLTPLSLLPHSFLTPLSLSTQSYAEMDPTQQPWTKNTKHSSKSSTSTKFRSDATKSTPATSLPTPMSTVRCLDCGCVSTV